MQTMQTVRIMNRKGKTRFQLVIVTTLLSSDGKQSQIAHHGNKSYVIVAHDALGEIYGLKSLVGKVPQIEGVQSYIPHNK
jgi:hypothetical protein